MSKQNPSSASKRTRCDSPHGAHTAHGADAECNVAPSADSQTHEVTTTAAAVANARLLSVVKSGAAPLSDASLLGKQQSVVVSHTGDAASDGGEAPPDVAACTNSVFLQWLKRLILSIPVPLPKSLENPSEAKANLLAREASLVKVYEALNDASDHIARHEARWAYRGDVLEAYYAAVDEDSAAGVGPHGRQQASQYHQQWREARRRAPEEEQQKHMAELADRQSLVRYVLTQLEALEGLDPEHAQSVSKHVARRSFSGEHRAGHVQANRSTAVGLKGNDTTLGAVGDDVRDDGDSSSTRSSGSDSDNDGNSAADHSIVADYCGLDSPACVPRREAAERPESSKDAQSALPRRRILRKLAARTAQLGAALTLPRRPAEVLSRLRNDLILPFSTRVLALEDISDNGEEDEEVRQLRPHKPDSVGGALSSRDAVWHFVKWYVNAAMDPLATSRLLSIAPPEFLVTTACRLAQACRTNAALQASRALPDLTEVVLQAVKEGREDAFCQLVTSRVVVVRPIEKRPLENVTIFFAALLSGHLEVIERLTRAGFFHEQALLVLLLIHSNEGDPAVTASRKSELQLLRDFAYSRRDNRRARQNKRADASYRTTARGHDTESTARDATEDVQALLAAADLLLFAPAGLAEKGGEAQLCETHVTKGNDGGGRLPFFSSLQRLRCLLLLLRERALAERHTRQHPNHSAPAATYRGGVTEAAAEEDEVTDALEAVRQPIPSAQATNDTADDEARMDFVNVLKHRVLDAWEAKPLSCVMRPAFTTEELYHTDDLSFFPRTAFAEPQLVRADTPVHSATLGALHEFCFRPTQAPEDSGHKTVELPPSDEVGAGAHSSDGTSFYFECHIALHFLALAPSATAAGEAEVNSRDVASDDTLIVGWWSSSRFPTTDGTTSASSPSVSASPSPSHALVGGVSLKLVQRRTLSSPSSACAGVAADTPAHTAEELLFQVMRSHNGRVFPFQLAATTTTAEGSCAASADVNPDSPQPSSSSSLRCVFVKVRHTLGESSGTLHEAQRPDTEQTGDQAASSLDGDRPEQSGLSSTGRSPSTRNGSAVAAENRFPTVTLLEGSTAPAPSTDDDGADPATDLSYRLIAITAERQVRGCPLHGSDGIAIGLSMNTSSHQVSLFINGTPLGVVCDSLPLPSSSADDARRTVSPRAAPQDFYPAASLQVSEPSWQQLPSQRRPTTAIIRFAFERGDLFIFSPVSTSSGCHDGAAADDDAARPHAHSSCRLLDANHKFNALLYVLTAACDASLASSGADGSGRSVTAPSSAITEVIRRSSSHASQSAATSWAQEHATLMPSAPRPARTVTHAEVLQLLAAPSRNPRGLLHYPAVVVPRRSGERSDGVNNGLVVIPEQAALTPLCAALAVRQRGMALSIANHPKTNFGDFSDAAAHSRAMALRAACALGYVEVVQVLLERMPVYEVLQLFGIHLALSGVREVRRKHLQRAREHLHGVAHFRREGAAQYNIPEELLYGEHRRLYTPLHYALLGGNHGDCAAVLLSFLVVTLAHSSLESRTRSRTCKPSLPRRSSASGDADGQPSAPPSALLIEALDALTFPSETALLMAIRLRNTALAGRLLRLGCDPLCLDRVTRAYGLELACANRDAPLALMLLQTNGYSTSALNHGGVATALCWCAMNNVSDLIEPLLARGADPSLKLEGCTPLLLAVMFRAEAAALELLRFRSAMAPSTAAPAPAGEAVARLDLDAVEPRSQCTALHVACELGQSAVVDALLRAGAALGIMDKASARTPLHAALVSGEEAIAMRLLVHTYDQQRRGRSVLDISAVDMKGDTALHIAARRNFVAAVEYILLRFGEVTPARGRVYVGDTKVFPTASTTTRNRHGKNPLLEAIQTGACETAELLIAFTPTAVTAEEQVLHGGPVVDGTCVAVSNAVRRGLVEVVRALLANPTFQASAQFREEFAARCAEGGAAAASTSGSVVPPAHSKSPGTSHAVSWRMSLPTTTIQLVSDHADSSSHQDDARLPGRRRRVSLERQLLARGEASVNAAHAVRQLLCGFALPELYLMLADIAAESPYVGIQSGSATADAETLVGFLAEHGGVTVVPTRVVQLARELLASLDKLLEPTAAEPAEWAERLAEQRRHWVGQTSMLCQKVMRAIRLHGSSDGGRYAIEEIEAAVAAHRHQSHVAARLTTARQIGAQGNGGASSAANNVDASAPTAALPGVTTEADLCCPFNYTALQLAAALGLPHVVHFLLRTSELHLSPFYTALQEPSPVSPFVTTAAAEPSPVKKSRRRVVFECVDGVEDARGYTDAKWRCSPYRLAVRSSSADTVAEFLTFFEEGGAVEHSGKVSAVQAAVDRKEPPEIDKAQRTALQEVFAVQLHCDRASLGKHTSSQASDSVTHDGGRPRTAGSSSTTPDAAVTMARLLLHHGATTSGAFDAKGKDVWLLAASAPAGNDAACALLLKEHAALLGLPSEASKGDLSRPNDLSASSPSTAAVVVRELQQRRHELCALWQKEHYGITCHDSDDDFNATNNQFEHSAHTFVGLMLPQHYSSRDASPRQLNASPSREAASCSSMSVQWPGAPHPPQVPQKDHKNTSFTVLGSSSLTSTAACTRRGSLAIDNKTERADREDTAEVSPGSPTAVVTSDIQQRYVAYLLFACAEHHPTQLLPLLHAHPQTLSNDVIHPTTEDTLATVLLKSAGEHLVGLGGAQNGSRVYELASQVLQSTRQLISSADAEFLEASPSSYRSADRPRTGRDLPDSSLRLSHRRLSLASAVEPPTAAVAPGTASSLARRRPLRIPFVRTVLHIAVELLAEMPKALAWHSARDGETALSLAARIGYVPLVTAIVHEPPPPHLIRPEEATTTAAGAPPSAAVKLSIPRDPGSSTAAELPAEPCLTQNLQDPVISTLLAAQMYYAEEDAATVHAVLAALPDEARRLEFVALVYPNLHPMLALHLTMRYVRSAAVLFTSPVCTNAFWVYFLYAKFTGRLEEVPCSAAMWSALLEVLLPAAPAVPVFLMLREDCQRGRPRPKEFLSRTAHDPKAAAPRGRSARRKGAALNWDIVTRRTFVFLQLSALSAAESLLQPPAVAPSRANAAESALSRHGRPPVHPLSGSDDAGGAKGGLWNTLLGDVLELAARLDAADVISVLSALPAPEGSGGDASFSVSGAAGALLPPPLLVKHGASAAALLSGSQALSAASTPQQVALVMARMQHLLWQNIIECLHLDLIAVAAGGINTFNLLHYSTPAARPFLSILRYDRIDAGSGLPEDMASQRSNPVGTADELGAASVLHVANSNRPADATDNMRSSCGASVSAPPRPSSSALRRPVSRPASAANAPAAGPPQRDGTEALDELAFARQCAARASVVDAARLRQEATTVTWGLGAAATAVALGAPRTATTNRVRFVDLASDHTYVKDQYGLEPADERHRQSGGAPRTAANLRRPSDSMRRGSRSFTTRESIVSRDPSPTTDRPAQSWFPFLQLDWVLHAAQLLASPGPSQGALQVLLTLVEQRAPLGVAALQLFLAASNSAHKLCDADGQQLSLAYHTRTYSDSLLHLLVLHNQCQLTEYYLTFCQYYFMKFCDDAPNLRIPPFPLQESCLFAAPRAVGGAEPHGDLAASGTSGSTATVQDAGRWPIRFLRAMLWRNRFGLTAFDYAYSPGMIQLLQRFGCVPPSYRPNPHAFRQVLSIKERQKPPPTEHSGWESHVMSASAADGDLISLPRVLLASAQFVKLHDDVRRSRTQPSHSAQGTRFSHPQLPDVVLVRNLLTAQRRTGVKTLSVLLSEDVSLLHLGLCSFDDELVQQHLSRRRRGEQPTISVVEAPTASKDVADAHRNTDMVAPYHRLLLPPLLRGEALVKSDDAATPRSRGATRIRETPEGASGSSPRCNAVTRAAATRGVRAATLGAGRAARPAAAAATSAGGSKSAGAAKCGLTQRDLVSLLEERRFLVFPLTLPPAAEEASAVGSPPSYGERRLRKMKGGNTTKFFREAQAAQHMAADEVVSESSDRAEAAILISMTPMVLAEAAKVVPHLTDTKSLVRAEQQFTSVLVGHRGDAHRRSQKGHRAGSPRSSTTRVVTAPASALNSVLTKPLTGAVPPFSMEMHDGDSQPLAMARNMEEWLQKAHQLTAAKKKRRSPAAGDHFSLVHLLLRQLARMPGAELSVQLGLSVAPQYDEDASSDPMTVLEHLKTRQPGVFSALQ